MDPSVYGTCYKINAYLATRKPLIQSLMDVSASLQSEVKQISERLKYMIKNIAKTKMAPKMSKIEEINSDLSQLCDSIGNISYQYGISHSDEAIMQIFSQKVRSFKQKIREISEEAMNQSKDFNEKIDMQKKSFKEKSDKLRSDYLHNRDAENERNSTEIRTVQASIDEVNASFDSKLNQEISKCTVDIDKFQAEYDTIKSDFAVLKKDLEEKLAIAETNAQELDEKLKEMESRNAKTLSELEREYSESVERRNMEHEAEAQKLEEEKEILKNQMQLLIENNTNKVDILRDQLKTLTKENDDEIDAKVRLRQQEVDALIIQMMESNAIEEKKLREKLDQQRAAHVVVVESMKSKLDTVKAKVEACDSTNAEKIKISKLEAEQTIADLDKKLRKLVTDQQSVLEVTKKQYLVDLKGHKKKAEQNLWQAKQRLTQLQQQFDAQKKQLEGEITSLIRTRNRLHTDFMNITSRSGNGGSRGYRDFTEVEVIADVKPDLRKDKTSVKSVAQMRHRFDSTNARLEEKVMNFMEMKHKCELEFNSAKQRMHVQLEKERSKGNNLEDEVRLLKIRKAELEEKIQTGDLLLKSELKKTETELQGKIRIQRDSIRQFREEIEKIRVASEDHEELMTLQSVHRSAIKEMEEKLDTFDDMIKEKTDAAIREREEQLKADKTKTKELIAKASARLDGALEQLSAVQSAIEEESSNEQNKWMEMRKEVAAVNMKLALATQPAISRPSSSAITPRSSARLPSLGKNKVI